MDPNVKVSPRETPIVCAKTIMSNRCAHTLFMGNAPSIEATIYVHFT